MLGLYPVPEDGPVIGVHCGFENRDESLAFALEGFGAVICHKPAVFHLGGKPAGASRECHNDVLSGTGLSGKRQNKKDRGANCFQTDHKFSVTSKNAPVKKAV